MTIRPPVAVLLRDVNALLDALPELFTALLRHVPAPSSTDDAELTAAIAAIRDKVANIKVRILEVDAAIVALTPPAAAPVITLLGNPAMTVALLAAWTDPGVTAADVEGGDLTSLVVVSGTVDTTTAGVYVLSYNVRALDGTAAVPVTRTVTVA